MSLYTSFKETSVLVMSGGPVLHWVKTRVCSVQHPLWNYELSEGRMHTFYIRIAKEGCRIRERKILHVKIPSNFFALQVLM